jgi:hypothetical protein
MPHVSLHLRDVGILGRAKQKGLSGRALLDSLCTKEQLSIKLQYVENALDFIPSELRIAT